MRTILRNALSRAALLAGSIVVVALGSEVVLRVFPPPKPGKIEYLNPRQSVILEEPHPLHPRDYSENPGTTFYRYRPNAAWATRYPSDPRGSFFQGNIMTYQMNSQGFRDGDFTLARNSGRARVAAIGDSFTLGEGVRVENVFPSILERLLQDDHPGAEVYNFGVNGYCTEDELVLLDNTVMTYRPDLIVLGYFMNDAGHKADGEFSARTVPAELKKWTPFLASRSRLVAFIANLLWRQRFSSMATGATLSLYQDSFLWEYNKRLLLDIRDTTSRGGARVLVVIFPDIRALMLKNYPYHDIHRQLGGFFTQAGIPYLDLEDVYRRNRPEKLIVHPVDGHPNEEAHRLAAEAIMGAIGEHHLLP